MIDLLLDSTLRRARHQDARALQLRSPHGIARERFVTLGGLPQWVGIRGEDRRNPLLLVLHGGPGFSYSVFTPLLRSWEEHFTLVQWDRRGVGKTYGRNGRSPGMTFAQMVEDAIELVELLRTEFHQEKVLLLGSSMGTVLGVPLVLRRPDLFHAYVGSDQNVDMARSESLSYTLTLERLRERGWRSAVRELEAMGPDPARWDVRSWTRKQQWTMKTDPLLADFQPRMLSMMWRSPGHGLRDLIHLVRGMDYASASLFSEFMRYDARQHGMRFELPVFLLQGAEDVFTSTALAEAWFDELEAPHKEKVLLEDTGHFAAFVRPERFLDELLQRVRL